MQMNTYTVGEAAAELVNDQAISVAGLTVDGKAAVRETVAELTQAVMSHSERQANTATEFLGQLEPEMAALEDARVRVAQLLTALHNTPGSQEALQEEFFALEGEVNRLARRIVEKNDRLGHVVNELLDPVGSLSRLQSTFPTLRRSYLYRFGK